VIFLEKRFSEKCWTHEIEDLVKLAGLEAVRNTDIAGDPILGQNWKRVEDWDERSRYEMKTQAAAEDLYNAIADIAKGVMQWIRVRW
jgi:hypothetical protein